MKKKPNLTNIDEYWSQKEIALVIWQVLNKIKRWLVVSSVDNGTCSLQLQLAVDLLTSVELDLKLMKKTVLSFGHWKIPNVWGHVNIIGEGAGQAVIQLKVQYGIDWNEMKDKPTHPYFDLVIKENYSYFRNKSHVNVKACFKYVAPPPKSMKQQIIIIYLIYYHQFLIFLRFTISVNICNLWNNK